MDVDVSSLVRDNGIEIFEIPKDNWGFINPFTVSIDSSEIIIGALYTLTYQEVGMLNERVADVVFEIRSATTPAGLIAATYRPISQNEAVRTHGGERYHQLRVTLSNVNDLRDFRFTSMVLKGLNLFGAGGTIPGLRP